MKCSDNKSIGFHLSYISREAHKYFTREYEAIHLNRGNVFILKQLYREDGLAQNEISANLHLDKAGIARNICKLIEAGIIEKRNDKNDKRINRIFLTEKGLQLKERFQSVFSNWETKLTNGFSQEELEAFKLYVKRMISNIEENR